MKKKAFVTGATGFLGSYLCRYLILQGYQVKALKRTSSKMDLLDDIKDEIEWVIGDILDPILLLNSTKDIDFVFHCAAIVSFSKKDRNKMMQINVEGTTNIVESCLSNNVKKLIHTSSIAAIGRSKNQSIIDEETNWQESKYNTAYAKSKYLAEEEVWKGKERGLEIGIINPSIILGSGYWDKGSSKLFTTIFNGLKFYTIGATGFVDVRDVAKSLYLVAESDISGERFIINGANTTYRNYFNKTAQYLKVKPPTIKITPFLREASWRLEKIKSIFTGKHPIITKETALISSLQYEYDNQKSLNTLGLKYIPFEKTISETCELFIEYSRDKTTRALPFYK